MDNRAGVPKQSVNATPVPGEDRGGDQPATPSAPGECGGQSRGGGWVHSRSGWDVGGGRVAWEGLGRGGPAAGGVEQHVDEGGELPGRTNHQTIW